MVLEKIIDILSFIVDVISLVLDIINTRRSMRKEHKKRKKK